RLVSKPPPPLVDHYGVRTTHLADSSHALNGILSMRIGNQSKPEHEVEVVLNSSDGRADLGTEDQSISGEARRRQGFEARQPIKLLHQIRFPLIAASRDHNPFARGQLALSS